VDPVTVAGSKATNAQLTDGPRCDTPHARTSADHQAGSQLARNAIHNPDLGTAAALSQAKRKSAITAASQGEALLGRAHIA
jgi:hypothetical protein